MASGRLTWGEKTGCAVHEPLPHLLSANGSTPILGVSHIPYPTANGKEPTGVHPLRQVVFPLLPPPPPILKNFFVPCASLTFLLFSPILNDG